MKALVATLIVIAGMALGLLLLVGHLARVPVNGAFRADPIVATILDSPLAPASPVVEPKMVAAVLTLRPSPPPTSIHVATISSLPTRTVPPQPSPTAPPIELLEAWAAPTALPTFLTRPRAGCDAAYPDEDTCIPPGPRFAQGCAITDERSFSVLPPDPQSLDHDGDGIGCEPIT